MRRRHEMPFGATWLPPDGARFRLWAPDARQVDLVLEDAEGRRSEWPTQALAGGWRECLRSGVQPGQRYAWRIDGGLCVPDPASRANPDDVHGFSRLVDPGAYRWRDAGWRGRPWHEAVIYELHVGTFTPQGRFDAVAGRLDELAALGITAIELMPVADFPGRRNWGYDGVLPFAPDATYGPPEALKALVDAAHARGLMVLLDVVYNHFGPDGNYLHLYAGRFFDAGRHTPWGAAIDFDGPSSRTVRDFFVHNALYWLEEFHLDGLRLDAVHALGDRRPPGLVQEIARAVQAGPGRGRAVHLVLEDDRNLARPLARGGADGATAQWNDDLHHAAHVLATGEHDGYYADYAARPAWLLGRALAEGFAYQGEPSVHRGGAPRGEPSAALPPSAFVGFLQTHDQVGNRAHGERIGQIADPDALRALVACVLLAPAVPLIFMGEEYAASTPFLYFCDHHGDLAQAVARGRRAEFAAFARFADPQVREGIPDPGDPSSFERSRLDGDERERPGHREWLALYRQLLALRRQHLVPWLPLARSGRFELDGALLTLRWPLGADGAWHLRACLGPGPAAAVAPLPGTPVYRSHPEAGPPAAWSVSVSIEVPRGG